MLGGQTPPPLAEPRVVVPPKLRPARPSRPVGMLPWVLLAGILCGLLVAAYFLREPITRMVPGADSLYAALGLGGEDPAVQLEIGNVKTEQRQGLIAVRGDIFNPKEVPLKLPPLKLVALDADKKQLGDAFFFRTKESDIAPGETLTFRILYDKAPRGMTSLRVTFGKLNAREP